MNRTPNWPAVRVSYLEKLIQTPGAITPEVLVRLAELGKEAARILKQFEQEEK